MKKLISAVLAVIFTMSLTTTAAFAKSSHKGNGNFVPPGIAKKLFNDADQVKWAQKSIEKLKQKGLVSGWNNMFLPMSAVTKAEAIAMALRIMGWEDEAQAAQKLPAKYKGQSVQKWAIGYIATAYEKGILDDVDMMYFQPHAPVTRHEVAKYVIRALGKEEEAEDYMDEDLSFDDASAIPQGSVGYVYLVDELDIMKGSGDRFNPMGTLTRAEMAVLFCSLDDKVDSEKDEGEYRGTVQSIEDEELTLKVGNTSKSFEVSEDVVIYEDGKRIDYSDLDKGSYVLVEVKDGEVVYIETVDKDEEPDKIISLYEGVLEKMVDDDPAAITVKVKDMTVIFEVIDDVEIFFDGVEGDFEDMTVGDSIAVTVDNRNRVVKILVDRELDQDEDEIEGIVDEVETDSIKITVDGKTKEYRYGDDMSIVVEGYSDRLSSIKEGMTAEITLKNNLVESITAKDHKFEAEGTITDIDRSNDKLVLELEVEDEDYSYEVSDDASIEIEDVEDADADDLKEGMKGEFEIVNTVIVKISIED